MTPTATTPTSRPVFPSFDLGANNTLTPSSPQSALGKLKSGQLRRCPGAATEPAADNSSPFVDGELLSCDPAGGALMGAAAAARSRAARC